MFAALVTIGFSRTVIVPAVAGVYIKPWWVHLHGLLFFSWTLLLVAQASLAAAGKMAWHRTAGAYGAWLIAPMIVMGLVVVFVDSRHDVLAGQGDAARSFFYGELADLFMFASLAIPAMWLRSNAEIHKRLVILGSLGLLGAAVGRIPEISKVYNLIFLGLIASLLVYDLIRRRKLHPASVVGATVLLLVQFTEEPIGNTATWLRASHRLLGV